MFSAERLAWNCEGKQSLRYRLAKPGRRGETVLELTPQEFLDRIAELIPPPRRHRHRHFGVLAPNSPWRQALTARAGLPIETELSPPPAGPSAAPAEEAPPAHPVRYL